MMNNTVGFPLTTYINSSQFKNKDAANTEIFAKNTLRHSKKLLSAATVHTTNQIARNEKAMGI